MMKKITLSLLILIGNLFLFTTAYSQTALTGEEAKAFTAKDYRPGRTEHIVLFKYKEDITEEQRQLIKKQFMALKSGSKRNGIPYIASIISGSQNSLEGLNRGYEQAFIVTFRSEGDRNFYIGTPTVSDPQYYDQMHNEFKNFIGPFLRDGENGILVFDFKVDH
jgi:Stress responsive A/B Barrel Domain